ncbi:MAG: hypothetical protein CMF96_03620 [Candidatus Marinimicrobia bacterium]|nr:hypothetical protein [Candidatus Neomarinimicrobiota bacterium]|tara:strand:- start:333 stop:821 length:489 start_codon:yes stop_codon:yes gene_type:complete
MKLNIFKYTILFSFFLSISLFSQSNLVNKYGNVSGQYILSSEPYVTGDDGIIRMYVNVIGHVKYPGTYLVYEGIDILSLLSLAGGPLPGTKLNSIKQVNGEKVLNINLEEILNSKEEVTFKLYPHNTIFVEQSISSYLFTNSSLISSSLQILSIILTILNSK